MKKLPKLYWLPLEDAQESFGLYEAAVPDQRPAFNTIEPTPENARAGAIRAADWLTRTQVSSAENLSGDTGRYYGVRGGIRGQSHIRGNDETGQYIDGRTTSYALCGFLGFADPKAKVLLEVV